MLKVSEVERDGIHEVMQIIYKLMQKRKGQRWRKKLKLKKKFGELGLLIDIDRKREDEREI